LYEFDGINEEEEKEKEEGEHENEHDEGDECDYHGNHLDKVPSSI
jgi:hypothetical protein